MHVYIDSLTRNEIEENMPALILDCSFSASLYRICTHLRAFHAFALKRLFNEWTLSERVRLSAKRIKQHLRAFCAAPYGLALYIVTFYSYEEAGQSKDSR